MRYERDSFEDIETWTGIEAPFETRHERAKRQRERGEMSIEKERIINNRYSNFMLSHGIQAYTCK